MSTLIFIIMLVGSILVGIGIIAALLMLFVKKVLKNNNELLARVIVGLLILQFVLGMLANLFVQIPDVEPYVVFHFVGPILLHTLNALILLILTSIFLKNAIRAHRAIGFAIAGLCSIATATTCGVIFVNAGQNDIYSFVMSLGFITAFTIYTFVAFSSVLRKK